MIVPATTPRGLLLGWEVRIAEWRKKGRTWPSQDSALDTHGLNFGCGDIVGWAQAQRSSRLTQRGFRLQG